MRVTKEAASSDLWLGGWGAAAAFLPAAPSAEVLAEPGWATGDEAPDSALSSRNLGADDGGGGLVGDVAADGGFGATEAEEECRVVPVTSPSPAAPPLLLFLLLLPLLRLAPPPLLPDSGAAALVTTAASARPRSKDRGVPPPPLLPSRLPPEGCSAPKTPAEAEGRGAGWTLPELATPP